MKHASLIVCLIIAAAVTAGLCQNAAPAKKKFTIDKWAFTWTVAKEGETRFCIEKDQDKTRCSIWKDSSLITLTAADAELVGAALSKAAEVHGRLKAAKADASESIKAGSFDVSFNQSEKIGFYVRVAGSEMFSSVMLDKAAAMALGPAMIDAKAKAAFVDATINP